MTYTFKKTNTNEVGQRGGCYFKGSAVRWVIEDSEGYEECVCKTKKLVMKMTEFGNTIFDGRGDLEMAFNHWRINNG